MGRKAGSTQTAGNEIPRFVVKSGAGKKTLVGKIPIATIPLSMLMDAIESAIADAEKAGVKPSHVRGTINLYSTED